MGRNPRLGLALRLLGPLIEGVALFGMVRYGRQGRIFLGRPVETFFYAGLALGLALVIVGLMLASMPARRGREES